MMAGNTRAVRGVGREFLLKKRSRDTSGGLRAINRVRAGDVDITSSRGRGRRAAQKEKRHEVGKGPPRRGGTILFREDEVDRDRAGATVSAHGPGRLSSSSSSPLYEHPTDDLELNPMLLERRMLAAGWKKDYHCNFNEQVVQEQTQSSDAADDDTSGRTEQEEEALAGGGDENRSKEDLGPNAGDIEEVDQKPIEESAATTTPGAPTMPKAKPTSSTSSATRPSRREKKARQQQQPKKQKLKQPSSPPSPADDEEAVAPLSTVFHWYKDFYDPRTKKSTRKFIPNTEACWGLVHTTTTLMKKLWIDDFKRYYAKKLKKEKKRLIKKYKKRERGNKEYINEKLRKWNLKLIKQKRLTLDDSILEELAEKNLEKHNFVVDLAEDPKFDSDMECDNPKPYVYSGKHFHAVNIDKKDFNRTQKQDFFEDKNDLIEYVFTDGYPGKKTHPHPFCYFSHA